jgi:glycosyltransferase involved in cell wall biosynthesis
MCYNVSTMPKIIAAMPAYNEKRYIGTLVLKVKQYADEVIVIDDGSTDSTYEIAKLAGATVFQHEKRKGKGAAIQKILTEARKKAPDVLVLLDADFQHNPDEIPNVIKPILEGFDLVIGSREAQANKTPRYRKFGQKAIYYLARVLSGEKLTDSESGFRALSKKAIAEIHLSENGFAVETEMITKAANKGLKITEVPISNIYIGDGSTLNPVAHGLEVLTRIITMISESKPLFFFGGGGGILVILGLFTGVRALYIFSTNSVLPIGTTLIAVLLLIIGVFSVLTGIILHMLARRRS